MSRFVLLPLLLAFSCIATADTPWFERQHFGGPSPFINDGFGTAVAVDGNTAAVSRAGAFGTLRGAVYVYIRTGSTWTLQQALTPSDMAENSYLGYAISLSGDTLVVGAYGVNSFQGAAYVFVRNNGVWTQQQKLTASDGTANALFGFAVGVSGNTAIIGAGSSAYVFQRSGATWTQQQKLGPDTSSPVSQFGRAVAISGDTIVVGDKYQDLSGAVSVFVRNGSAWTQQQKLTSADSSAFGFAVSIDGDTVVSVSNKATATATAHVFVRSGTVWTLQQRLSGTDSGFIPSAWSTAVSGSTILLGDVAAKGIVYRFTRTGAVWTQSQILTPADAVNNDQFGWSVAISGDTAFIGAPFKTYDGQFQQGAAYAFTNSAPYPVTINSTPQGLTFSLDGGLDTFTPLTVYLDPGNHTISWPAVRMYTTDTRYLFQNWSDGITTNSRTINVTGPATYLANHMTQYLFTPVAVPPYAGAVGPEKGFYNAGSTLTLSATPNAGAVFTGWSGLGNGSYTGSNPSGTVTMNAPIIETGAFSAPALPGLRYVPVTPCRVSDTRNPDGPFGGPSLKAEEIRDVRIPASACGIPTTAAAYALNVTVVPKAPLSFLTVFPTGTSLPLASTLNSGDARVRANAAIVPAGTNGAVSIYASLQTEVILDINGYFEASNPAGLAFYPVAPCRLVDTRNAAGLLGGPALVAAQSRTFPVRSACNLPATAAVYSLNFTAVPPAPLSFLTTWPTGGQRPFVSTLNSPKGVITANAALVAAGTNGSIDVYATDATDLVVDVNGYFAPPGANGLLFHPLTPCRAVDTRTTPPGLAAQTARSFALLSGACSLPVSAQAYSLNVTAVPPGPLGYLTLFPTSQPVPLASTLNAPDGATSANAAILPAGNGGAISAFASHATEILFDVNGYFAP